MSKVKVYTNIQEMTDFCHRNKIGVDTLSAEAVPFANVKGEYTLVNNDGFWQRIESIEDLQKMTK